MEKAAEIKSDLARGAQEIINTLLKAKRNLRLYPTNNPMYEKIVAETYHKATKCFDYAETLELEIGRNEIRAGDEVVYKSDGKEDNLALFFFRDGLRTITLEQGLEEDEIQQFLEIMSVDFDSEDVEEDIVTLLWEKDFRHIKYRVDDTMLVEEEDYAEEAESKAKENLTSEESLQQAVEEVYTEEEPETINPVAITEADLTQLAREISRNEGDHLPKLINILFDMLFHADSIDEFRDVVGILNSAVEYAIRNSNLSMAIDVFRRTKDILNRTKSDQVRENLSKVLLFAGSPVLIKLLGVWLDTKEGVNEKDFREYVSVLDASAIPKFIELLGDMKTQGGRNQVLSALGYMGRKNPESLAEGLRSDRWDIVRNVILVLRQIKNVNLIELLGNVHLHPDARVRREALKTLAEFKSEKLTAIMAEHLLDEDESTRIIAAQGLGNIASDEALMLLLQTMSDKKFMEEQPGIIKKYFEALAQFSYDDTADFFEGIITKNPLFGRSQYNEFKSCAIYGLGYTGDARALKLLEPLQDSKVKILSENAINAIKRIQYAKRS